MANDMNADLLRQTREEILRRGNQQIQEYSDDMRKKQEISDAKAIAGRAGANSLAAGVAASFTHPTEQNDTAQPHPRTDREYGVSIAQLNTDIYYANRIVTEYTSLRNGIGQSGDDEYDQSLRRQMDQLLADNGYSTLDDVKQKLESMQSQRWMLEQERRYANLESNPDFAQYSKPSSWTPTAGFGIQFGKLWLGKGDPKYDYINNLGNARELAAESRGQEDNVTPYGMYDVMEPEEVARYNYLYHTQGEKAADEYLEYLEYILSERKALLTQTASTALAEGHPFFSNGLSVISKLQSGVGLLDAALQGAGNSVVSAVTGEEQKPINYYRAAGPSIATSAIRGTRSRNIANKYGVIDINAEEHPILAKVLNGRSLADLYQLGMSMVDSVAAAKLSPGLGKAGTYLLGGSAGTQAMLDAVGEGATDDQAITMGILSAAAEIIFESYEVENLLGSNSNILKSVANQAITEAIGEGATNISNTVSDILVMQDKSQFMQNVQKYMEQGMDKKQANLAAFGDAAIALGWDTIGGLLSGWLFGLAGPAVSGANDTNQNVETNQSSDFIVEEAEESGGSPAGNAASQVSQQTQQQAAQPQATQQQAQQAQQTQQTTQPQAAQQRTQQTQQAQQATQQQESSGSSAVAAALNYFNENGRVSNSVADNILANPSAVNELQRSSGVKIPGIAEGATHSQKRSAVKSAISQLAGTNPKVSTQGKMDSIMDALQDLNEGNTTPAPEKSGTDTDANVDAAIASGLRGEAYVAEPQTMDQGNPNPVNGEVEQDGGAESGIVESSEAEKSGSSGTREQNAQPSSAGSPVVDSSQQQAAKKGSRLENAKAGKASATGNAKSNTAADNAGIKGTGAAERNFSGKADYQELLHEGNVQRDRPGDVRPVEVPKTNAEGKKVSEFAGNAYGAKVTPDAMASEIESLIQDGYLSYDTRTNRESLENARDYIYGKDGNPGRGEAETRHQIQRNVDKGRIQDGDIEKAMLLYAKYADRKSKTSTDNASSMMVMLQEMATMSGRNLQLFSMFQKMTPEGQLMTVKKTAQRAVDNMVRRGRAKKGSEANIPKQLESQYLEEAENEKSPEKALTAGAANMIQEASSQIVQASASDAVESAVNNALAPYSEQSNESWQNGSESGNANIQTNDMAERVGQRVANNLQAEARSSNQSVEDILYREIMRFAEDKARAGRQKTTRIEGQNLDALRDYYRYRPFFQTAWDTARARVQQAMNNMREGDARIPVIEQFLASGDEFLGIENESPVTGLDRSNPASTLRRGTKEAAAKAGIRMENRKPGNVQRAKNQLRDVLLENWQNKQNAAEQIASIAMEGMNLSEEASAKMAGDIMAAFYADLADQSARRLSNMFKDGKTAKKVHDTLAQRLEKLYNMGAFANSDYRQAAFESVFGQEGIDVPDGLLEEFVESAGDRKASIEQQIYMVVGSQIKATLLQKWNTLRYLAMMGNVRSNERNIVGNVGYIPYKTAKDIFGSALEIVLPKNQRTKSILNPLSSSDKALIAWAKADAKSKPVQDALRYSAKVGDDFSMDVIKENQPIFKWKGLENYRKLVEWAPSAGDMLFKNPYYTNSLAGFLKARGYTAENLQNGSVPDSVIQEARTYAIEEAMKATFNDRNAFSDAVSNLRYYGDNPFLRAANLLGEGIMPFRRTPANVVARIVDNSPVSIARGFIELGTKVRKGEMSAATAIDHISSGLTGTGLAYLGYTLASGIFGIRLRGKVDDEDKKRRGYQSWALEFLVDGEWKSYSIEWAAPANIPLFIGANIYQEFNEREYDTSISSFSKFLYACRSAFEPMLALSCLSSLNDALSSVKYAEDGQEPFAFVAQGAFSYFTQAFPSMWRQGINAAHGVKHETFANNQDPVLRELERFAGRIPGVGELFHTKSIDEWGRETPTGGAIWRIFDSFFNPGKLSTIDNSDLEKEVERLNGTQPESVSPPVTAKTITYTDASGNRHENYRLTEDEYSTLARVQGSTAKNILEEIISSDSYDTFTDAQRANVFSYVYDYAREIGREEAIDGYVGNFPSWLEEADGDIAGAVMLQVINSDFSRAFSDLVDGKEGAVTAIDRAYSSFINLPQDAMEKFAEGATGRVRWMIDAGSVGMDAETFASMYQIYRGIDKRDLSVSQKANQWSYELQRAYERKEINMAQLNTLKRDMVFRYSGVVDTAKFDALVSSGFTADEAKRTFNLLDGLKPEEGYKTTRDIQRAEAIASSNLSDADKRAALYIYLNDAQDTNLREMLSMGFTPSDYVAAWRINDSTSGKGRKAAIINSYQEEFGVDYETAEEIYKIYN